MIVAKNQIVSPEKNAYSEIFPFSGLNQTLPRLITDHLGSTRVVLDQNGNVDSWSDYYPFGKEARGSSTANRPKEQFTGKERDSEIGLDYFGARYYNAEIARWISVDALSGKYPSLTPYNYTANNPVFFVDPNGLDLIFHGDKSAIDAAVGIINKHLEGSGLSVAASYSGDGAYIDFAGQAGNLSESQQALVGVLAGAMFATTGADGQGDAYDVNIGLVENSPISLSIFDTKTIDVSDIIAGYEGSEAITPAVVLGHEIKEQTVGQNPTVMKANPNKTDLYNTSHNQAVKAEEKIGGYTRVMRYGACSPSRCQNMGVSPLIDLV
jgi:RHS repeat-associated protein